MAEVSNAAHMAVSADTLAPEQAPLLSELPAHEYVTIAHAAVLADSKPWPVIKFARTGALRTARYGELVLVSLPDVVEHAEDLRGMVLATTEALVTLEDLLTALNKAQGSSHTLQSLADECGVDLEDATRADVSGMACHIGSALLGHA